MLDEQSDQYRLLSFDEVEDRLVDALHKLWRMEGGRWPFASDGPWHLIRKEWWDWDARDEKPIRKLPLSRAEMAHMQEALMWLTWVRERDRRLVVLVVRKLAGGAKRPPWLELLEPMGLKLGADGLRRRYERALAKVVRRINARV